jgi:hypothetical protein
MQQPQQALLVRDELLQQLSLHSRNNGGDEPARLAHFDHRDQRAILVESGERPASGHLAVASGTPSVVLQRR